MRVRSFIASITVLSFMVTPLLAEKPAVNADNSRAGVLQVEERPLALADSGPQKSRTVIFLLRNETLDRYVGDARVALVQRSDKGVVKVVESTTVEVEVPAGGNVPLARSLDGFDFVEGDSIAVTPLEAYSVSASAASANMCAACASCKDLAKEFCTDGVEEFSCNCTTQSCKFKCYWKK